MKKRISIITVLLLLICTPLMASSTYVDNSIKVLVNGSPVSTDIVMNDNSVFVPLRFMSNQLNAQVAWDSKSRTVAIKKDSSASAKTALTPPVVNGSDEFKSEISKALALVSKNTLINNLAVIKEAPLENASATNLKFALTNLPLSTCSIDFDECKRLKNLAKLTSNQFSIFLAGILVHESHHAYAYSAGLLQSLPIMDIEVLAFANQRKTLKLLNAPQVLLDITSVNKLVDTNYNNTLN